MLTGGGVYSTSRPVEVGYAHDQLRRLVVGERFRLVHVTFVPSAERPLLLVLIRIENPGSGPVLIDLTETWGVERTGYRTGEAAAVAETAFGLRALADCGAAPRARPPEEPPGVGLALDVRFAVPPGERRQLYFAHVAPPPGEEPAPLVRAFRGDVARELARTAAVRGTSEPV